MTGRQDDRQEYDRQRILDEYMIEDPFWKRGQERKKPIQTLIPIHFPVEGGCCREG
jgi:hypothetical protein